MMDTDPVVLNSNEFLSPQSSLYLNIMFVEEKAFPGLCFMLYVLDKQNIYNMYVKQCLKKEKCVPSFAALNSLTKRLSFLQISRQETQKEKYLEQQFSFSKCSCAKD